MSSFADQAKLHLANYKRNTLMIAEMGVWKGNQRKYEHILPEGRSELNILETIRDSFWSFHRRRLCSNSPVSLHSDFAHLNSSQALAFNLFFPFVNADIKRQRILLNALGLPWGSLAETDFELVLDAQEGTNFDF